MLPRTSLLPALLFLALLAFLAMAAKASAAAPVVGRAGITLEQVPAGMTVVLDSPAQFLVNGEEAACGWKSAPLAATASTDQTGAMAAGIRAMTGVANANLLRQHTLNRPGSTSRVIELAADAISDKGAFLRRIVVVIQSFAKAERVVTGYCIAPGARYELLRNKLISIAGSARPAVLASKGVGRT